MQARTYNFSNAMFVIHTKFTYFLISDYKNHTFLILWSKKLIVLILKTENISNSKFLKSMLLISMSINECQLNIISTIQAGTTSLKQQYHYSLMKYTKHVLHIRQSKFDSSWEWLVAKIETYSKQQSRKEI